MCDFAYDTRILSVWWLETDWDKTLADASATLHIIITSTRLLNYRVRHWTVHLTATVNNKTTPHKPK